MDVALRLIMVGTILVIATGIVLFLVQGEADSFGDFLDSNKQDANCEIMKEKGETNSDEYVNNCLGEADDTCRSINGEESCLENGCTWEDDIPSRPDQCVS